MQSFFTFPLDAIHTCPHWFLRTQTVSAFSHSPTLSPTSKPSLRTTCRNPPEVLSPLKFGKQMLSIAFAAVRLGVLEILKIFFRTPNLHISKRFARATGVGLGEREMRLRRDAPATKSSGYPRPRAEPRRRRKRLRCQVPRRVTRGALRSKVARGCARTAKQPQDPARREKTVYFVFIKK